MPYGLTCQEQSVIPESGSLLNELRMLSSLIILTICQLKSDHLFQQQDAKLGFMFVQYTQVFPSQHTWGSL